MNARDVSEAFDALRHAREQHGESFEDVTPEDLRRRIAEIGAAGGNREEAATLRRAIGAAGASMKEFWTRLEELRPPILPPDLNEELDAGGQWADAAAFYAFWVGVVVGSSTHSSS